MDDALNQKSGGPLLMGIVNVTPDSFSDGGRYNTQEAAIEQAIRLWGEGADWIDIGGESTRPDAAAVDSSVEQQRVIPVIKALAAARPEIKISIVTSKTQVAEAGIDAGALMVNDVRAGLAYGMPEVCRNGKVKVVLMHMRGTPSTMQLSTQYVDLVEEVFAFLETRVRVMAEFGIDPQMMYVDPGIGFGKALADNLKLIGSIPRFRGLGAGVVIGASRKRFIGEMTSTPEAADRVAGSVGAALAAAHWGANMIRVHDVKATRDAMSVFLGATTWT